MNSQEFFSKVTNGATEYKPKKGWYPDDAGYYIPLNLVKTFNKYEGSFERHIATSIPLYRDMQFIVANGLISMSKIIGQLTLWDIGGSEGSWVKMLAEHGFGKCAVLDCNHDMEEHFNKSGVPELASFYRESFTSIGLVPKFKSNVVHAGMAFQFMDINRVNCIDKVKSLFLEEGGLFLIEEKVIHEDIRVWVANEKRKDEYKRQFYTEDQIEVKSRNILSNMHNNLIEEGMLPIHLKTFFRHTQKYYQAGNFVGYACSDNYLLLAEFMKSLPVSIIKY